MIYENHPAANVFPMMPEAELAEMAADIRENGLLNAIEIYEGKIIDGRNRYKACSMVGVKPDFIELDLGADFDPVTYVLSLNLHRRHLNAGQLAAVALRIEEVYAEEIYEKEQARKSKSTIANLRQSFEGKARDKAAEMLNVGGS